MANKVTLKRSSVVGKIPQASDLDFGEVALNFADGRLYYKNSSNAINFFEEVNSFQNIAVAGESTLSADGGSDTLTLVEGDDISITTDPSTNEVTINSTASGSTTTTGDVFAFQFFLSDGTEDNIGITAANEIPFFLTDGTSADIPLVSIT
jgi:hypothetical protein